MKRFFKYLGVVLAGAFAMSSCVQEEFVTYEPEAGTVQTLGDIAGCTLDADGNPIETTFTEVDFGVSVPVVYTLNVGPSGKEIATKLSASIAEGKISIAQKDLNSALLNMGAAADVEFALDFQLVASLADLKGSAITDDESYVKYSNVVTAKFVPYSTTVLDADKYDHIYIIGAAESVGGWSHGNVFQFLYNYNGDGNTYTGMIYYTDGAAGGWKLTGADNWDNGNWGSPDQAEEAEAPEITLLDDGGSKDIKCYSLPYYMWTFDKSTLKLKKEFGFTTMGIVGDFNDWKPDAENVVMTYNPYLHRFYIDWDFATDAQLKFTADGAWDLNFGVDMAKGGDNIPVPAGKYRIYLDFNKNEYTFDANMYGKEEPGQPSGDQGGSTEPEEPVKALGWGLVGEYNDWGGEADVMLASDGTFLAAKGVALSGQVKFRKDNDWAVNFGAPGEVEPVEITVNTELELVAGGKNFTIAEGTYDVYFDEANAKAWFINDGSYPGGAEAPEASPWALIGEFNSWAGDYPMYVEGEYHVAKGFVVAADGKMKFRKDGMWNYKGEDGNDVQTNLGGTFAANAEIALTGGGSDLVVTAGTYDVYLKVAEDGQSGTAYFMTDGKTPSDAGAAPEPEPEPDPSDVWGVVGTITGWADNADINMVEEGDWFVAKDVALTATDEFKFRTNGKWGTERTATTTDPVAINTEYEAAAGSGNIKVAVDGTYDLYLAKTLDKFYVMTAGLTPGQTPGEEEPEFEAQASEWGVVGVVNGWGNSAADIVMYTTPTEGLFVAKNAEMPDGAFKIRANNEWNDAKNYGFAAAGTAAVDHAYDLTCGAGSKDITLVAGTYDIYFDLNNLKVYVMTPGKDITEAEGGVVETPDASNWYLVGNFNGWATGDANYKFSKEGDWYVFKGFTADGQGVKFNAGSWDENRGGTFSAADTAISIAHNGSDMYVAAGTYDVYMNAATDTAYFMTPGTTPAN